MRGKCDRGDDCKYSHDSTFEDTSDRSQRPCYDFRNGKCTRGDSCRFSHDNYEPDPKPEAKVETREDCADFVDEGVEGKVKLIGMEWFRSIGSPKRVVAPMVDASELAYRMQCRKHGAQLVYTQMFSSHMFVESAEYRRQNFQTIAEDRPLIVQFAGDKPDVLLKAAKMVQGKCDAVDINLGCPQGIAKRGHYGAFLMEELDLLTAIVSKLANELNIPVTCKTRIYHDFNRTIRLMETLVNAGASLLTVHGRTREEKKQKIGMCDWITLQRIKAHFLERGVPIICNGGIANIDDFWECLEVTDADGCMLSEAILEDPAVFSRKPSTTHSKMDDFAFNECDVKMTQLDIAFEYMDYAIQYPPRHLKIVRGHLFRYLFRYFDVHPEIRNKMAEEKTIEGIYKSIEELREIVGDNEEKYTRDWYSRHRTAPEEGSDRPGGVKKDGITCVFNFGDDTWGSGGTEVTGGDEGNDGGLFAGIGMFDDEDE